MGAWGPAIFSNDLTCDVRDSLDDFLSGGISDEEAIRQVLGTFQDSLEDADEADEVWLALAARLSALGRLPDTVRERALDAIDSGRALALWKSPPGGTKGRGEALTKLRDALTGAQSQPTALRRRKPSESTFKAGDLLRIATSNDRHALALVVDEFADNGGR